MPTKKILKVLDGHIAHSDIGGGDPIVLLHGNPMHGFLWHALVPYIQHLGRLIVPDLIGMGDSARLPPDDPDRYSFANHRRYLDAFLEQVGVTDRVIIVGHDWGGALGFDWAWRHREKIKGIAYFETHVNTANVVYYPERVEFLRFLHSEAAEDAVLHGDFLFEFFLGSGGFFNPLDDAARAEIMRPWIETGENRRAMLSWVREGPLDGRPHAVYETIDGYEDWLRSSPIPKLLLTASHGFVTDELLAGCRQWPNQTETSLTGAHFLQMDAPAEMGQAVTAWHKTLE